MLVAVSGCDLLKPSGPEEPVVNKPTENILPRIDPKKEKGLVSTDTQTSVVLTVRNKTKSPVTLHWLDETDGARVYYKDVPAAGEVTQDTFEDHYWIILDKADKPLGIYKLSDKDGVIVVK
jgi:hypothetical protein